MIQESERRVPIVGKIPILGIPFRSRKTESGYRTLLVFVSPRIVNLRTMSEEALQAGKFWEDWENAGRIEEERNAMELGLDTD